MMNSPAIEVGLCPRTRAALRLGAGRPRPALRTMCNYLALKQGIFTSVDTATFPASDQVTIARRKGECYPGLTSNSRQVRCSHRRYIVNESELRSLDIRPREVLAGEKQRHACHSRDCVRHAVAEIQASGMTSPSKPQKCGNRSVQVFFVERDHFGFQAADESEKNRAGVLAQSRAQDHRCFEQSRNSDNRNFGLLNCFDQPFVPGSFKWIATIAELSRTMAQ
jgi:hypothetical protein